MFTTWAAVLYQINNHKRQQATLDTFSPLWFRFNLVLQSPQTGTICVPTHDVPTQGLWVRDWFRCCLQLREIPNRWTFEIRAQTRVPRQIYFCKCTCIGKVACGHSLFLFCILHNSTFGKCKRKKFPLFSLCWNLTETIACEQDLGGILPPEKKNSLFLITRGWHLCWCCKWPSHVFVFPSVFVW